MWISFGMAIRTCGRGEQSQVETPAMNEAVQEVAKEAIDVIIKTRPGESPFNAPAVRAMFAAAESTGPDELAAIAHELAAALATPSTQPASCLAISCGTLVELGADPAIAGMAIIERFVAAAKQPALLDRASATMFDQAAMAHLCRSVELRVAARRIAGVGLLDRASQFTRLVLGYVDQLTLLVLAPAERKGFRVQLEAIATNAHLFTLLQAALISGGHLEGEALDPRVVGVAAGDIPHRELVADHERFHFASWQRIAHPPVTAQDTLASWLPVDGSPHDIPALADGRRVISLGPRIVGKRSWDSNFFANIHDALRSRVAIEQTLTAEEVASELAVIASQA